MQNDIEISVIVATYNRALSLLATLESLGMQTLSNEQYEVIVVDDGSTDCTSDVVRRFKEDHPSLQMQYARHSTNRFKSAACNTGIQMARGNFVAFTDDDIRPVPYWLEAHLTRHKLEARPVAIIGLVLYPDDWEEKSNWIKFANENYKKMDRGCDPKTGNLPPLRVAGGNMSLPRKELLAAGSFNEKLRRGVDGDLACRLHLIGLPSVFERKAVVYHYADAIHSIDKTLKIFHRYYEVDRIVMNENYPWALQKYGHWYLEPYDPDYDNLRRSLIKKIVKIAARQSLEKVGIILLKKTDSSPRLYSRTLHRYVHVCEAAEAIKLSTKCE